MRYGLLALLFTLVVPAGPAAQEGRERDDQGRHAVRRVPEAAPASAPRIRHETLPPRRAEPRQPGGPAEVNKPPQTAPRKPGDPARVFLPSHGLRPADDDRHQGARRWSRDSRRSRSNVVVIPYFVGPPPYMYDPGVLMPATSYEPARTPIIEVPRTGRLVLDIHPYNTQIFSDGYFIGMADDFRADRGGVALEGGPHRIEFVAPGYERVAIDVKVVAGESVSYRQALVPMAEPAAPPPAVKAPTGPTTFYLIPGCYMGNVAPTDAKLPPTCDVTKAITVTF